MCFYVIVRLITTSTSLTEKLIFCIKHEPIYFPATCLFKICLSNAPVLLTKKKQRSPFCLFKIYHVPKNKYKYHNTPTCRIKWPQSLCVPEFCLFQRAKLKTIPFITDTMKNIIWCFMIDYDCIILKLKLLIDLKI